MALSGKSQQNKCLWLPLYYKHNERKTMDLIEELDRVSAEQFFEWYDEAQALADKHNVEISKIYNIRQVWDYAFSCGALAYAKYDNEKAGK